MRFWFPDCCSVSSVHTLAGKGVSSLSSGPGPFALSVLVLWWPWVNNLPSGLPFAVCQGRELTACPPCGSHGGGGGLLSCLLGQGLMCLLFHIWLLREGLGGGWSVQPGLSICPHWELLEGTLGPEVPHMHSNQHGGVRSLVSCQLLVERQADHTFLCPGTHWKTHT